MTTTNPPLREITPIAMSVHQGKVITQEFVSRDGHVLAGYRSVPDTNGFPAWEQHGDLIVGFSGKTRAWFPTEDAARAWVLSRVSGEAPSAPASAISAADTAHGKAV
jgi:hypothetical protein